VSLESAETMLDKAIDLLAGAQALHGDGNDHAAILLAIHSGINSADAINEFYTSRSRESTGRLRTISGSGTPNVSLMLPDGLR